jgi:hypothetical protein
MFFAKKYPKMASFFEQSIPYITGMPTLSLYVLPLNCQCFLGKKTPNKPEKTGKNRETRENWEKMKG